MRIGILGSGLMGGKLGTIFARAGHEVVFSYSHSKAKLEKLKPSLPPGVEIVPTYDRSSLIKRAVANLEQKLVAAQKRRKAAIWLSRRCPPFTRPSSGTWTSRVKKAMCPAPMPARTALLGVTARNVPPWRT